MPYHTKSTVPACVRPEVVKAWNALWRRLYRMPRQDRRLEYRSGTPFKVGCAEYVIRYSYGRSEDRPPEGWGFYVRTQRWASPEKYVGGVCSSGCDKPYIYLDTLQTALDDLIVEEVMCT